MFTKIVLFSKKHLSWMYAPVRRILFPVYLKLFRNKKLESFTQKILFNFSFAGVSFKIWLNPENGFVDQEIFSTGVYEPDVLLMYKEYLKSGSVYVDIGTNIGQHALYAAALVGATGKVLAYEPVPSLFTQLSNSKFQNNFVQMELVNKAVGKTAGESEIYINRNNMGASSLYGSRTGQMETISIGTAEELSKLDKIDFIKIDTEGYEWIVIQTILPYVVRQKPVIFFEYTPAAYEDTGKVDVLQTLVDQGYELMDFEDGYRKITDVSAWVKEFTKIQTNILCVPKNKNK